MVRPETRFRTAPSPIEQGLLGLLLLGIVAMLSLPAARGTSAGLGWMPLWLLLMPAASLATARVLRRLCIGGASAVPAITQRRRRPVPVAARRRGMAARRTARLPAASVAR